MNRKALLQRWGALHFELDQANVRLLAVSKYASDESVRCLVDAGQMDFGESRPQNLRDRAERFPDVNWHMIGPLQKNKAKYIGRYAFMWHSVEDIETAQAVAAHVRGRRLPVMLQVNVAGTPHQHGVEIGQAGAIFEQLMNIPSLEIRGLMCMAPKDSDGRACFRALCHLRDKLSGGSLRPLRYTDDLKLCMGMSGDYRIAIEEGSDMVRLGSTLFGLGNNDFIKNGIKEDMDAKP
ncbi:MAG: YggS family pyridoxal phosphate-dependent enzyme [Mariprofundaceae bacterium]|nr:YggS family pyridoxal phosphate-dependent enzyme [Mariprofundaceae bacterium]